ncbi:MAG: xylulokinase [Planctomycetaceae bacterium]|jgi:xylulokinase|nr:xylulokinase [Planctomycetaceae bacterium]
MKIYLGIDIGTSGTKTLAMRGDGKILCSAMETYPCYSPKPLWSEQDPDDWWQATIKSVRKVMRIAKLKPADVAGIGLSGQMHGSVFLDKNNNVIRRAILWNDQRTSKECGEIEDAVGGRDKLIQLVANPAMTGFTAPKILWLRNNEPKHYEKTRKVLLPKDEIRRRLTGEFATDVSDASGMLLIDMKKRDWSNELIDSLHLDREMFAKVYESEDITGRLTSGAAKLLGLTTDCFVVGGAGDCAAGAVGNGIVSTGTLSTSIGTSGVMFVHSDEVRVDPLGRVHTFCHAVRGKWHQMGVNLSSGGALQWFRNSLCHELVKEAAKKKVDVYELMTNEAAKVQAGSEGLFFLPYLSGERTPHADPNARGCFIGLTLSHSRGHLIRSIMEGVAYSMRDSLEIFTQSLGVPVREIRASGGGSRSPLWRQIQADCFGRKVVTINSEEGPAFGVALLASVAGDEFSTIEEACKKAIKVVKTTNPNSKSVKTYNNAMPVYQQLYKSLKNDFKTIGEL